MQKILTGIIVFVCVAAAVTAIVRWFRGRGSSCGCGCECDPADRNRSNADNHSPSSTSTCAGCALAESCRKPEKKQG